MSEPCERCGKRGSRGRLGVEWHDTHTDAEGISVCQRCSAWLLDRWDEAVDEARCYRAIQTIDRPKPEPEPSPPPVPNQKRQISDAARAQRSAAAKASAAARAQRKGNGTPTEPQRNRTESNGSSVQNERNLNGIERNSTEAPLGGGRGWAASSSQTTKESSYLEAEAATSRARTATESNGTNGIQRSERNSVRPLLRSVPSPRPSIDGLPPPHELKRPNSAAERKAIADLLEELQLERPLANLFPLDLLDLRPYFDDFALRALALTKGDMQPIVEGYRAWLAEEWTQANRGPWVTWFRQWQGKLRAKPATPPAAAPTRYVQEWPGVPKPVLDALEAALVRLAEDGLSYAASQLALLRPIGTPDSIELHAKDPFFLEFCREHWGKDLPPNVRLAPAKQEVAS